MELGEILERERVGNRNEWDWKPRWQVVLFCHLVVRQQVQVGCVGGHISGADGASGLYIAVNGLSGFVGQLIICDLILWLVKAVRAIDSFSSVFSQHCTSSPTVWGNAVLSFSECYRSFDQYVFLCGSHICTDTLTKWTKVSLWPQKSILLVANSTKT